MSSSSTASIRRFGRFCCYWRGFRDICFVIRGLWSVLPKRGWCWPSRESICVEATLYLFSRILPKRGNCSDFLFYPMRALLVGDVKLVFSDGLSTELFEVGIALKQSQVSAVSIPLCRFSACLIIPRTWQASVWPAPPRCVMTSLVVLLVTTLTEFPRLAAIMFAVDCEGGIRGVYERLRLTPPGCSEAELPSEICACMFRAFRPLTIWETLSRCAWLRTDLGIGGRRGSGMAWGS